ncbi:BrnA antitoxin family protein [uncultured Desulfovibrio sp.]|uniref:BrnA antitoxin family protein n=1 Tax=uncultured Desulfovibrio sp. TaxID=167968 RepID=UPI0026177B4F|nr:BrnA antitoxin family protein [uncultured Desulfovibrio sp.]
MLTPTDRKRELEHLAQMTDEQAYANALADPDNPPLTEAQLAEAVPLKDIPGETLLEKFHNAQKREPKQLITARFDADVVRYYKAKGKGYQAIMNAALRACMEAELARKTPTTTAK